MAKKSVAVPLQNTAKIQALLKEDIVTLKINFSHSSETGKRLDPKTQRTLPPDFIQEITVQIGDKTVLEGQVGAMLAHAPFMNFKVRGAKIGDKVTLNWADNKGEKKTSLAVIQAGSA